MDEQLKKAIQQYGLNHPKVQELLKGRGPDKQPRKKRGQGTPDNQSHDFTTRHNARLELKPGEKDPHHEHKVSMHESGLKAAQTTHARWKKEKPDTYHIANPNYRRMEHEISERKKNLAALKQHGGIKKSLEGHNPNGAASQYPNIANVTSQDVNDMIEAMYKAAPKGVDEAKYKRCKDKVKQQSPGVNEYAVCASSLKKSNLNEQIADLYKAEQLFKGEGEGSRGGKIIGHTSSGKPIYAKAGHRGHKDFDHKDHHEAYVAHSIMAERHRNNPKKQAEHSAQQARHKEKWSAHEALGRKIPSYDQSHGKVFSKLSEKYDPKVHG